jgi:hypothetical protein
MSDNIEKEIEFYKALRLVTSNIYVRVILVVLVLSFLDVILLRFFDGDIIKGIMEGLGIVDQTLERIAED